MEEKIKKISVRAFEKIFNNTVEKTVEVEWNGLSVNVKKTIDLTDMLSFVDSAVKMCFNAETGQYLPELEDCAFKNNLLHYYTNISLPAKFSKRYEWIYGTDIISVVSSVVNQEQLFVIREALKEKIHHLSSASIEATTKEVNSVAYSLDELISRIGDIFSGVGKEDIEMIAKKMAGNFGEKELVKFIADKKKEAPIAN